MIDMKGPAYPGFRPNDMVIGISGYARAGKDTIASVLVQDYGFTQFSFADKLRDVLYTLNPWVKGIEYYPELPDDGPVDRESNGVPHKTRFTDFQSVIKEHGWGGYKESIYGPEMRRLLQVMGTEVGRNMIADDIWVRELDKYKGRIVISDVRFPNEWEKVKSKGGQLWRVARPGTAPVNPHVSETSLDEYSFDQNLYNEGTLLELGNKVRTIMTKLGVSRNSQNMVQLG